MDLIILFSIGLSISIFSIVIGLTIPIYLAIMQGLFPSLILGNITGADKVSELAPEMRPITIGFAPPRTIAATVAIYDTAPPTFKPPKSETISANEVCLFWAEIFQDFF